ncbi:T cell receptor alpha variable 5, partial [Lemmus lemmus]
TDGATSFFFLWLNISLLFRVQYFLLSLVDRVQEIASTVINCTYVDSASFYFPWYKQGPREHSKLVLYSGSNMGRKQDERLIVLFDKKAKHFSMHSTGTQAGDSAIYLCAASTHYLQPLLKSVTGPGAPSTSCVTGLPVQHMPVVGK